ncbi:RNA polymerase-binding protein RbpA [Planosporangium flavigriseum]|uniref:RNA polymerase-binding protein RbpA n=1 Tax=Planosporangium flavigriseum TaxID=373681 RepID=A0A8J3LYA1_9ACTN|nr:RNA polymerase-binding protein RbpA [Planosporangium flavigriseum]NJC65325.1 RNA polymerase-binding protein RbpA [Planosporangium flavigriseum]GIG73320.1 RNA polymerase-binding protein RbpA [Planosporangium flavigriseum]
MAAGNTIRGSRVGSGPMRWLEERSDEVPRRSVTYWCASGHATSPSFAADVAPPPVWDCPRCGLPAGPDENNPPDTPRTERYKSHLAYVKERRSDADAAAILAEALARVRQRRGR